MLPFANAIAANPNAKLFRVLDSCSDDPADWSLEPLSTQLLSDTADDGFHIIQAIHVLPDGTVQDCFMDINLPERITDYAYFPDKEAIRFGYHHQFPGEIIPAMALDCFRVYELFYSRRCPEVGINVLKHGLAIAGRKKYIAQDLAYILRDERRYGEAVEMFEMALEGGPSSSFIYRELADAYAELGDADNVRKYAAMFVQAEAASR